MSEQESSLKNLFLLAKQKQENLDLLDPRSNEFSDTQQSAIKAFEESRELVSQMALYSVNEEIEDVSTLDVQCELSPWFRPQLCWHSNRYLAIDYLLAELLLRSYHQDRLTQLKQASELLESFLTRLDQYDILTKTDRRLLERYQANRKSFSVVSSTNPEERRNTKVARFQEEKALKAKLKVWFF